MNQITRILAMWIVCIAASAASAGAPYLLHLPGVGGHRRIDDQLVRGLRAGGIDGDGEIYEWTDGTPGLQALSAYIRNQQHAAVISLKIAQQLRSSKDGVIITSHSGGCAIAVWALERLPDDVCIDSLLMIAPALSPGYDLSAALKHVRGRVYVFSSPYDLVLDWGTRTFGTMDRAMVASAGLAGFAVPENADRLQYAKLVQIKYDPNWTQLGYAGDHAGAMTSVFARNILAPLLQTGELPTLPATQPATP